MIIATGGASRARRAAGQLLAKNRPFARRSSASSPSYGRTHAAAPGAYVSAAARGASAPTRPPARRGLARRRWAAAGSWETRHCCSVRDVGRDRRRAGLLVVGRAAHTKAAHPCTLAEGSR